MSSYIAPSAPANPLSLKTSYSAPEEFKNRKAPAAIDIWRHEVSSCCHVPHSKSLPQSPVTGSSESTDLTRSSLSSLPEVADGGCSDLPRRPSFLKKIFVVKPKKSLAALRGKKSGEDLRNVEGEGGDESIKTEMYDLSALKSRAQSKDEFKFKVSRDLNGEVESGFGVHGKGEKRDSALLAGEEEDRGGSVDGRSMEIATSGSESSQDICSINERRARLERAERLLRGRR